MGSLGSGDCFDVDDDDDPFPFDFGLVLLAGFGFISDSNMGGI